MFVHPYRLLLAAILVCAAGLRVAEACSCNANPPCAAVWRADAVFVGTVVDRAQEPIGGTISWTVHRVAVSQRLHGSVESLVTLLPGGRPTAEQIEASKSATSPTETMSTCDYRFEVGRQYIIYARRADDGRWTTSMCAGTKPIAEAAPDFAYISGIPNAPATGRVYGRIERFIADPANMTESTVVPASGIPVELVRGSNRLTVSTDAQGALDVQVPPGDYTIAPVVPETIRVYGSPFQAPVPARGCAPVQFGIVANGRVVGRVVQQDGSPVTRTRVDVVPADLPPGQRPDSFTTAPSGMTDENGEFEVGAILPGRYVIAINARFGPALTSPYATTYFPGVGRDQAEVVEIEEGERKPGFTIVVRPLEETTLSGVVLFDDERPVAGADVSVSPADHLGTSISSTKADSNGRFELRVLAGMNYRVRAGIRTERRYLRSETMLQVDQQKEGVTLSIAR